MSFSLLMRERERPPYKGPKRAVLRGERSTGQLHASQDTALLHPRLLPPRCPLLPPSHLQVSVPFSPSPFSFLLFLLFCLLPFPLLPCPRGRAQKVVKVNLGSSTWSPRNKASPQARSLSRGLINLREPSAGGADVSRTEGTLRGEGALSSGRLAPSSHMATPRCTLGRRQRSRKEKRIPQGVRCSFLCMSLLPAQGPLGVCCPFLACVLDGGPLFLTLNVGLCWSLPSELLLSSESPVPASACVHRPSRDSRVLPHSCAFWHQKCWVTRSSSAFWPSRLPPQSHLLPVVQSRSSSFLDAALGNFPLGLNTRVLLHLG